MSVSAKYPQTCIHRLMHLPTIYTYIYVYIYMSGGQIHCIYRLLHVYLQTHERERRVSTDSLYLQTHASTPLVYPHSHVTLPYETTRTRVPTLSHHKWHLHFHTTNVGEPFVGLGRVCVYVYLHFVVGDGSSVGIHMCICTYIFYWVRPHHPLHIYKSVLWVWWSTIVHNSCG